MDVILTQITPPGDTWSLADRLGRNLGSVWTWKVGGFEIKAEPTSKLDGIADHHATLDGVMDAISKHMGGACSLRGRGWA